MQKVRFSVFADLHVHDHRAPDSIGRLKKYFRVSKEMVSDSSCHNAVKITPRVLSEKLILPMQL